MLGKHVKVIFTTETDENDLPITDNTFCKK